MESERKGYQLGADGYSFPLAHVAVSTSFGGSDAPCGPYVLPMGLQQTQAYTLQILIPCVAGPGVHGSGCTPASNSDFALSWRLGADGISYMALVMVQPTRLFSPDLSVRAQLRTSFAAFLQALEQLELASPGCLVPGGAAVITNRVASSLPLLLSESLNYQVGLDATRRSVDLQPGMRLAVETAAYQFASSPRTPGAEANSFVPRGTITYEVNRAPNGALQFNPLLSQFPVQVCPPGAPLAGLADLCSACDASSANLSRRYWRLVYPNQFPSPTFVGNQPALGQNVALLGANSLAELESATQAYIDTKSCACKSNPSVTCLFFNGRATITPEFPVVVMGTTSYVPVGTTVHDLVDTLLWASPDDLSTTVQGRGMKLWRYAMNTLGAIDTPFYSQVPVGFEPVTKYITTGTDQQRSTQWNLPLIKGDALALPLAQSTQVVTVNTAPFSAGAPMGPYLIPPGLNYDGSEVTLPIVGAALPNGTGGAITGNPDFAMSADTSGVTVTVQTANAATDDPDRRAKLRSSFASFRAQLDQLEQQGTCLIPGAADLIARRLAASLPLRLDELLYYFYDVDAAGRTVDLQPGMRLAVQSGAYQFVAPPNQPGYGLNGYTVSGEVQYQVVRNERQRLTFSPFVRSVDPYQVTDGTSLAAGGLDLAQAGSARRHYRLVYPTSMAPANAAPAPKPQAAQSVVLLGADSLQDLNTATQSLRQGQPLPAGVVSRYLSGRATLLPLIQVSVQGALQWVPLGTTLRQVLDRYLVLSQDELYSFATRGTGNILCRMASPAIYTAGQPLSSYVIEFEQTTVNVAGPDNTPLTQWDLPLVKGDTVQWSWTLGG